MSKLYDNPQQAALLGYFAGIIDGEGCIRINRTTSEKSLEQRQALGLGAVYAPTIAVGMVVKEVPQLLHKYLSGSLREERVPGKRSIWRWTITSRPQAIEVLNLLLPMLVAKRKQAELLLDFCQKREQSTGGRGEGRLRMSPQELQRREDAYQAMRKLNAVGAAASTE